MSSSASRAPSERQEASETKQQQSSLYKVGTGPNQFASLEDLPARSNIKAQLVMTPVVLVSFLVSLAWVDFRYSLMRSHSHSEEPSMLPHWLHRILYREAPYQYVRVDTTAPASRSTGEERGRWYYHTKQRKLMRMEVDDAFQVRGLVLMVLGLGAVATSWGVWCVGGWIWDLARSWLA